MALPGIAHAATGAPALVALEQKTGTRIGVAALDTGNSRILSWREGESFVMCSTFKLSLAAAVLARVDRGTETLDRLVQYDKPTLGVSPETLKNWPHGMTIAQLCRAAMIYSDNTAANVLLAAIGGPQSVTEFWRSLGDMTSRLDDIEPKLNLPSRFANSATPTAMLADLKQMLLGNALAPASRARLLGWMHDNTTGGAMLRAGLPRAWQVGDKTGRWNGDTNACATNDLAIITPPGRKPILAVCYTQRGPEDPDARAAVVAVVGKILADMFA